MSGCSAKYENLDLKWVTPLSVYPCSGVMSVLIYKLSCCVVIGMIAGLQFSLWACFCRKQDKELISLSILFFVSVSEKIKFRMPCLQVFRSKGTFTPPPVKPNKEQETPGQTPKALPRETFRVSRRKRFYCCLLPFCFLWILCWICLTTKVVWYVKC